MIESVQHIVPRSTFVGTVSVPGDKSGSHRALMISALASGTSEISGLSPGLDVAATSDILVALGATRNDEAGKVYVEGPSDGLRATTHQLDCGNSGTTIRLMAGIVGGIEGSHVLVGDASLSKRPMDRVAIPLEQMGVVVNGNGPTRTAPLSIVGSSSLTAIEYTVPTPSAQVKSAILLAGLFATGETRVHEANRTRSTTEDMLIHAGISVESSASGDGRSVVLRPGRPHSRKWHVPGDPSQAAFFAVLGLIGRDAEVSVASVDTAPERIGFVNVLRRMGGNIELIAHGSTHRLTATTSPLVGVEIHSSEIPSVDEAPILTVAAAAANGVTAFRDMGELRLKESDRFEGSMNLARLLGATVWSEGDDYFVEGLGSAAAFSHFEIFAGLDHRMVMSSAVAGAAGNGCSISGAETVTSSYPQFFTDMASLR